MRARRSGPIALIALVLAAMPVVIAADSHSRPDARPDQQIALQARKLIDKAEREGPQRVIVGLNADFVPEGRLQAAAAASQRQEITNSQASLMASLAGLSAVEHHRFRYIPFLALEAGASALKRLASSPTVVSLEEDRPEPPVMFSSNSVIGSRHRCGQNPPILRDPVESGFGGLLFVHRPTTFQQRMSGWFGCLNGDWIGA